MPSPTRSVAELEGQAAALLTRYLADRSRDGRTAILRELAIAVVDLRSHFKHADGQQIDWGGRSPGYRESMARIYQKSGIEGAERVRVQGALRWHTGEAIRERATPAELAKVGLVATPPKERLKKTRDHLRGQADAAAQQDVPRLAAYAQALLEEVDPRTLANLSEEECIAARFALEAVAGLTSELLAGLDAASGPACSPVPAQPGPSDESV